MPKFRAWTPEEHAWALECASAGDSFDEIGAALDCPDFYEVWARLGVTKAMPEPHRTIAELYFTGLSLEQIGLTQLPGKGPRRQLVGGYLRSLRRWGYQLPPRAEAPSPLSPVAVARKASGAAAWRTARERNTAIVPLVDAGLTNVELAARFGVTKNVIIGVANRVRKARAQAAAHG